MPWTNLDWFDAHLDLAYMAALGRDMRAEPEQAGGVDLPAGVTFASLARGRVKWALATIFTEPGGSDSRAAYPEGDFAAAARLGRAQLQQYQAWEQAGLVHIGLDPSTKPDPLQSSERARETGDQALRIGILIENADPIASPDELEWWQAQGVVAVGLAWTRLSRYAGGNTTAHGLTDHGRAMVREADRLGVVLDASHLSDRALAEVLELTQGPIIASHSNCRALIATDNQRHLTDDAIRQITSRGGIIGINLFSPFIIPGALRTRRATLQEWAAHVERIVDLAGSRDRVALGSDMDGGFSAQMLPEHVDGPGDLWRLVESLSARGWSDLELANFACGTWRAFWLNHPTRRAHQQ
ncbi:MAG: membrane dipeptidase [Planctomycetota bacterium]|nr:membrane dipeptidase [Planctomycetota bacterium]